MPIIKPLTFSPSLMSRVALATAFRSTASCSRNGISGTSLKHFNSLRRQRAIGGSVRYRVFQKARDALRYTSLHQTFVVASMYCKLKLVQQKLLMVLDNNASLVFLMTLDLLLPRRVRFRKVESTSRIKICDHTNSKIPHSHIISHFARTRLVALLVSRHIHHRIDHLISICSIIS